MTYPGVLEHTLAQADEWNMPLTSDTQHSGDRDEFRGGL